MAYNASHAPYLVPDDAVAEYIDPEHLKNMTPQGRNGYIYRAMVSRMDIGIGEIVSALEENRILDNTIIMFMSDNGGLNNIPVGSTCAPLRGQERRDEGKDKE